MIENKEIGASELIIVPTLEIIRTSFFMDLLTQTKQSLLLVGPTATGKSVLLKQYIRKRLQKSDALPIILNFTGTTTQQNIQKKIESKMDKSSKGVLKAAAGKSVVLVA